MGGTPRAGSSGTRRLVITEKPSVARDVARVLGANRRGDGCLEGEGLVVTWCVGHLLELADPASYEEAWKRWDLDTLPMVPPVFALQARKGSEDQWHIVARWLQDPSIRAVVNACDAGREGELIFRYAYQHAGCALPVERFWVSSLTDEAIRMGWQNLRPGAQYDALADAARSRSEADWLVGMNGTRAMTCRTRDAGGDALWSVGRVQTPTLAMIVARDREIAAFVPETYWRVDATMQADGGGWQARWFRRDQDPGNDKDDSDGDATHEERLVDPAHADALVAAVADRPGVVASATRKARREAPPLLYDLTSLQRRANQRYGLSAQRTLEIAQSLYERHKLLTYPRTDARHLTSDQVPELPDVVRAVAEVGVYREVALGLLEAPLHTTSRMVDDGEVGDHHAIIPTQRSAAGVRLDADEKRIYDLVARRLLAGLSPDAVIDTAELIVEVDVGDATLPDTIPLPPTFRAKGRVIREPGWQAIDPPKTRKDVFLPNVQEGDVVTVVEPASKEGQTRPPRPHDDASLLLAMETAGRELDDRELKRAMRGAGLGTPATRAAILQTLLDRDYVTREGRALRGTDKGGALIDAVPADELKSAELTGRWEKRLSDIADGSEQRDAFMADVGAYVGRIVEAVRHATLPEAALVRTRPQEAALGDCPACGSPVRARGSIYTCDTGRSCPFVVFGTMSKRAISTRMVKQLLTTGRTPLVKGFKSRAGKPFDAGLMVKEDGKVGFWFEDDAPPSSASPGPSDPAPAAPSRSSTSARRPEDLACPSCGQGTVLRGRAAFGCSRWREGCGWRLPFQQGDRVLDDAEVMARIARMAASAR